MIAGLGLSVISLNFFISADLSIVERAFGAPTISSAGFFAWLRCLAFTIPLLKAGAILLGTLFVASDFSKLNRWFFHVDEFGVDRDLKEKLKSKATND